MVKMSGWYVSWLGFIFRLDNKKIYDKISTRYKAKRRLVKKYSKIK